MAVLQRVAEYEGRQAQQRRETADLGGERSDARSPWMTSQEACVYLRFTGTDRLNSLYRFLKAQGIPVVHRSRKRILIARADLDQALLGPTAARRRNRMRVA